MKIVITGAKGQLGQEIAEIIKNGKSQLGEIPAACKTTQLVEVDVDELDITACAAVADFMAREKPDVVINCAAMTNVDACQTQLELAMQINAIGVRNLAAACESVGAKLVHVSTDYVFAGNGSEPYCEWDQAAPSTVYGKSKLLGEKYAADFCTRYFIVRTAWLYGRYGNNFVKTMLSLGESKSEIKVVNDQRGNPTNANDLAHHLLCLAVSEEYGVYHCTGEGECTWFDFASEIMRLARRECKVLPCTTEEFPRPAPRPAYSSLNNLMLSSTVGNQMRPWQAALADFINNMEEVGI